MTTLKFVLDVMYDHLKCVINCGDRWESGWCPMDSHVKIWTIMGRCPEFVYVTVNLVSEFRTVEKDTEVEIFVM